MNQQREVIYSQRRKILTGENLKENIYNMIEKIIDQGMDVYANEKIYPEEWDYAGLIEFCEGYFAPAGELTEAVLDKMSRDELREELMRVADAAYSGREALFGAENMRELEKVVMLKTLDAKWMEHLDAMDMLRQGIGLRAYGQKDPLIEYKIEGYDMFQQMMEYIQEDIVRYMFRVNIISQAQPEDHLRGAHAMRGGEEGEEQTQPLEPIVNKDVTGRNELCPCGSGKKYKRCCGAN